MKFQIQVLKLILNFFQLKCGQAAAAAQQQRNESVEVVAAAAAAAAAAAVAGAASSALNALDLRTDPVQVTWDLQDLKSRLEPRSTAFPLSSTTQPSATASAQQQQPQTPQSDSDILQKVQQEKSNLNN